MIRGLYSSATGMKAQELMLDVTANNIANVNTNGFKRSQIEFADLLYATYQQAGAETVAGQVKPIGLQIGSGVRAEGTTKVFSPGSINRTGRPLDVAIQGDGLFKISVNGQDRYTRDGAFHVGPGGQLVTAQGYLVDGGVTLPPDVQPDQVSIGDTGIVSYADDNGPETLGTITLVRFSNPEGLSSEGGNLYSRTEASGQELTVDTPSLLQSSLEQSNVEVVTELVALITAQRAYEVNSRAIRAGDEMLSNTNDILR